MTVSFYSLLTKTSLVCVTCERNVRYIWSILSYTKKSLSDTLPLSVYSLQFLSICLGPDTTSTGLTVGFLFSLETHFPTFRRWRWACSTPAEWTESLNVLLTVCGESNGILYYHVYPGGRKELEGSSRGGKDRYENPPILSRCSSHLFTSTFSFFSFLLTESAPTWI